MNEHELKHWLGTADLSVTRPNLPPLNATKLERLVARRRRKRRRVAAAAVSSVLLAGILLMPRPSSRQGATPTATDQAFAASADREKPAAPYETDLASNRKRLESLQHSIQKREAIVAALQQAEELARLNRELAALEKTVPPLTDPSALSPRQVRYEAAAVSLRYADLLATEYAENELAAAEYRRIVSRFPGTTWSAAAERSLSSTRRSF